MILFLLIVVAAIVLHHLFYAITGLWGTESFATRVTTDTFSSDAILNRINELETKLLYQQPTTDKELSENLAKVNER